MRAIRLAIAGATGLVGRTTIDVLEEWEVPVLELRLLASGDSAGRTLRFRTNDICVESLDTPLPEVDAAIFALSRDLSRQWWPSFREKGIIVIDHSSEFRMDPEVPLVIPEINAHTLRNHRGLIANPNCTASIALLPLYALDRHFGLLTVILDSYQSVSGSGQDALAELNNQLLDEGALPHVYPRRIAHNVLPQVGAFNDDGMCDEELKIVEETRKILGRPDLTVLATTVRVPVRVGHSTSVTVELAKPATRCEIEAAFRTTPGMIYEPNSYRTPIEVVGKQDIYVGRLRQHRFGRNWIQFWATGDNLRKGAASNAVQILMELFREVV